MKWSFLTTNYNKVDALEKSIPSMLKSLPSDGELVIVDGGSTDGSIEALKSFDDNRIRIIVEESNLGEGRQLAMNHCRGDAVVEHLDTDRVYGDLQEYMDLYLQLCEKHKNVFLMTLDSVYLTSPETSALIGGWPPIGRAEERVYTDRALSTSTITPKLYPKSVSSEIDTIDVSTWSDRVRKWKYEVRDNIRCGFSLPQIIRFHHYEFPIVKAFMADAIGVVAWWEAQGMKTYGRSRDSWRDFPSWESAIDLSEKADLIIPVTEEPGVDK